jgi:hypothetical protein
MPFGLWTFSQDHNDLALINYAGSWFGWLMRPRLQPTRDLNSLWCVRYNKWTSGDSTHLRTFRAYVPSGVWVLQELEIKRVLSMTGKSTWWKVYITTHFWGGELIGRVMSQEVSRRPLTVEAGFQSQVSPGELCSGQSGNRAGLFFSECFGFSIFNITPPLFRTHTCCP